LNIKDTIEYLKQLGMRQDGAAGYNSLEKILSLGDFDRDFDDIDRSEAIRLLALRANEESYRKPSKRTIGQYSASFTLASEYLNREDLYKISSDEIVGSGLLTFEPKGSKFPVPKYSSFSQPKRIEIDYKWFISEAMKNYDLEEVIEKFLKFNNNSNNHKSTMVEDMKKAGVIS
jgi:hypothetical protein